MAYRGKYRPKNPEKYKGDLDKIIYRSSWELRVFRECDINPDIIWWGSETFYIQYKSPIDGKYHRYFPDVIVKRKLPSGDTEIVVFEIKPYAQTLPPNPSNKNKTKTGRVSRRYINEVKRYGVNDAKWKAAEQWCKAKGYKFQKLTEKELGL